MDGIANAEIDIVHQSIEGQPKFVLVAHSFGTLVALKLAQLLEKRGKSGHVILLDGAPTAIKQLACQLVAQDGNIDDHFVEMVLDVLAADADRKHRFMAKLSAAARDPASAKVQLLIDFLPDHIRSAYSTAYLVDVITAILGRYKIAVDLDDAADRFMGAPLQSPITLVRPTVPVVTNLTDDYGLQSFTERAVTVHRIDCDHSSMPESGDVVKIINRIADATFGH